MTRLSSCALAFLAFACTAACFGQSSQGYMNDVGSTPYGVTIPVENGYINVSNGNLHLEFPLAGPPQRGALSVNERLVYDSRIWMFLPFGSKGSYHWWPKNVTPAGGTDSSGGWRLIKGNEIGTVSYQNAAIQNNTLCDGTNGLQVTDYTEQLVWTDPNGSAHSFNASMAYHQDDCTGNTTQHFNPGLADDGSGYNATDDGSGNPLIIDNSGTQVYPQVIDRYGNYLSADGGGNLIDDTSRVPILASQNGNTKYYDVLAPNGPINNQGTRVRYTVTATPTAVSSNFQAWNNSDIHQWCNQCQEKNDLNLFVPVTSIQLPDGSQYTFSYDGTGELTSVTLPTGGTIAYGYTNIFDSSNTENRWLTSRTHGNDPAMTFTPSIATACSNYSDGCVENVNVHKPNGDETVYQLTLKNGAWNTGSTAYTGSANGGTPLVQVSSVNTYANPCSSNCNGSSYINGSVSTKTLYPTGEKSQTKSTFDPVTGKPSFVQEWDYIASGANFGGTPTRETDYTYTGFDVQTVKVLSNGSTVGQTDYGYTSTPATTTSGVAQHGSQNAGGPYLRTVSHALFGGNSSVTTYGMDDTGQVVSTSDPNGNPAAAVSYQCANSLPYQAKNPLGQTTQYGYDCNSGAVVRVQDPNDLASNRSGTTYAYESGAGRPQSVTSPDGGQTSYSYPSTTEVDTTVLATPSPSISSQDFLDSFGRKYQHVQAGVSSETTYDINGRPYCVTNPHTGSGTGTDGSTCVTAYDGLDRPLTQQQPDGTTLGWTYNGTTVTSTDEANKQWRRTNDAFGHLVKVVEPGNYVTTYAYDGLGNLQTINQGGVAGQDKPRVRTFVHDSLGRLINECHPEAVAGGQLCSANGPWSMSYSYYPGGTVHQQTDARGVTATLSYDALNRLTDKTYSDGTPGQHLRYGQTSVWMGPQLNTIGRLTQSTTDPDLRGSGAGCGAQSQNLSNANAIGGNPARCLWTDELYSYDAMGRATRIGTASPSEAGWAAHETDPTYNLAGQLTALRYPDGRVVTQSYDGAAHLQSVVFDNWNGQHVGYPYAGGFTYTPSGEQAEMTLGNGVYTHTPYNNRGQLCQLWVAIPGQNLIDKHYSYGGGDNCYGNNAGNNGTIQQIFDMKNGNRSQGFSYDGLNRLYSFSNGGGDMQQTYSLDPFGNFNQSGTLSFQAGMQGKNQFVANGMGYDQAGNVTAANLGIGQTNYGYDGANRMFNVNNGADYYTYDAAGDRMRKDTANGWTEFQYLNGQVIAEKAQDGSWSDYIYANGQKIARADGFDQRIHLHGTQCSNCGWSAVAWDLPITNYLVKPGDILSWRQYQGGTAVGGVGIVFTNGVYTNWVTNDTNGQVMNNLTVSNQWVDRTVALGTSACQQSPCETISALWMTTEGNTAPGIWDEYFSDIAITSTDGTVTPIYTRQASVGLSYFATQSANMTGLSAGVEHAINDTEAKLSLNNTTYYHGDHLGSARMTTSGEGWATSSDTFYPFGQEPAGSASPNHFQYAGLERDPETGLDHATFRQYSATQGRWMSPDPYDGSMDLGNPQSLNRYSYVSNNPLGFTDPSGLDGEGGGVSKSGCLGVGKNVGNDIECGVSLILDFIGLDSLFSHPKFHGSTSPRPNAHIWDEHEFSLGPPSGVLGLPSSGCEFGACGGGMGFAQADAGTLPQGCVFGPQLCSQQWATLLAILSRVGARAVPIVAATTAVLGLQGDNSGCIPSAGTQCYDMHSDSRPHNSWDTHYHIYQMNQNPIDRVCRWNKLRGTTGTFPTQPPGMNSCSVYPTWTP